MRFLYRSILLLHPPTFRREFGAEMLWIFDEAGKTEGLAVMLIDGLVSLARQWILRSCLWKFAAAIALGALQVLAGLRWSFTTVVQRPVTPSTVAPERVMEMALFTLAFLTVMMLAIVLWAHHIRRRHVP